MKGEMLGSVYDLNILLSFEISGVKTKTARVKQCFFRLPTLNQVLICCDGACKGNPGVAGLGFVARVSSGECIGAASGGLGLATNYLAEVMALIVAGEWAVSKQFREVCFQLDSNVVLLAFTNNKVSWIFKSIWERIRQHILAISLRHSYREVNFSVDEMAKKGVSLSMGHYYTMILNLNFLGDWRRKMFSMSLI
ncbi:uncharacterized protein LOC113360088 [Papaver somniferum]|uniref:uncharacterized protein LOC113360088 n=1 Tax=Papaver somniferum TaxID=3469 RepID=UPI000E70175A|nr:uncharacterized protein LOC113360088 [Papaver somniferum]